MTARRKQEIWERPRIESHKTPSVKGKDNGYYVAAQPVCLMLV